MGGFSYVLYGVGKVTDDPCSEPETELTLLCTKLGGTTMQDCPWTGIPFPRGRVHLPTVGEKIERSGKPDKQYPEPGSIP